MKDRGSLIRAQVYRLFGVVLAIAAIATVPTKAMAQYELQPGDVLELSIPGLPNFSVRLPIEMTGDVSVPLAGQLKIGGLTLAEARTSITKALTNKVYVQATNNGSDIKHLILPNDVMVTMAEFRPIYVGGHVARPGAYPFRVGMTVRQAIAVAGGTNLLAAQAGNPVFQESDLRAEVTSLSAQLAIEQDRIRQLQADLGLDAGASSSLAAAPVPAALQQQFEKIAVAYRQARKTNRDRDKAILKNAIDKANQQLSILEQKKKNDQAANQADQSDYRKVRELFKKGITANARLAEARRAEFLSADQLLQTIVQMSNVEQQRGQLQRQLDTVGNQARIDDWHELQQAKLQVIQLSARLKSANEKLAYAGIVQTKSRLDEPTQIEATVYRGAGKDVKRFAADQDLMLVPGDTVEVVVGPQDQSGTVETTNRIRK